MDKLFLCFIFQWRANTNDNLYFRFKFTFFIHARSRNSWLQACLCLLWCFLSLRNRYSFLILCVSYLFWRNFCLDMLRGLVHSKMFHLSIDTLLLLDKYTFFNYYCFCWFVLFLFCFPNNEAITPLNLIISFKNSNKLSRPKYNN